MVQVQDSAWFKPIEADETEPTQELPGREQPRKLVLVAEPVLERQDGCAGSDQRGKEGRVLVIGGCLERDHHQVARPNFPGCAGAFGPNADIGAWGLNR